MKALLCSKPRSLAGGGVALALGLFLVGAWAAVQFANLDDQPIGFVAPVEFSTFNIASGKAVVFRGDYVRATWEGDLVAESLLPDGSLNQTKWNARVQLTPTTTSWDTGRKIFTSDDVGTGVAFRWSGTSAIAQNQQGLIAGKNDNGQWIVNYIRGDGSNEYTPTNTAGIYRYRFSKMGAVIHSRPYYYEHGKDASGNPVNRVYVGANDGMLHSFDADTGNEVFAYVPSMLFSKLKNLTANINPPNYDYFVDGLMTIGKLPQTTGGDRTVLVGGLGAGAVGLYALDLTDPTPAAENGAAAAALVKWEIDNGTKAYTGDIGNVYGAPQLVKLNDGRTVVLSPNGVNSSNGASKLFVIDPATGAKLAEISAGSGGNNGLGAIAAVDYDGNGTVDAVYAGDQKGTLWKFDLSGSVLPAAGTALYVPAVLRPITAAPSVIVHPSGGYLVNFGTGRTMQPSDLTSTTNEYLYGIWDGAPPNATFVVDQTLSTQTVSTASGGSTTARVSSSNAVSYNGNRRGWRITLAGGERLIGADTLGDSGRYVITTDVPNTGSTQGGWLLQVDALTGGNPAAPFFDLNDDGKVSNDNTDRVPVVDVNGKTSMVAPIGRSLGPGVWSQPVLAQLNSVHDTPYFNHNDNVMVPATTMSTVSASTTTAGGPGIAYGHFDIDIYYGCTFVSTGYPCATDNHNHAYDDKYNVIGVNMLNASNPALNLVNPIPGTAAPRFKILLGNTRWSPAAMMTVSGRSTAGGTTKDVTVQEAAWNFPVSPGGFLSDTAGGEPMTFSRAELAKFTFTLAPDSFTPKEWVPGSGDVRAGLMPSSTGCVRTNRGGGVDEGGAWMNGAFVIQVVKDTTPDSAVEPSFPATTGGFLLKKTPASQANQLTQYTVFWHNGPCYGQAGWSKTPAPDTASANNGGSAPAGTADPTGSVAYSGGSTTNTSGKGKRAKTISVVTYNGVQVTVTRDFADTGFRQIITRSSDGVVLDDTLSGLGETRRAALQQGSRPHVGRLAWKELVR